MSRHFLPAIGALIGVALGAGVVPAHAQDNKITVQNKIAQCQGCHGIKDWKTAFPARSTACPTSPVSIPTTC